MRVRLLVLIAVTSALAHAVACGGTAEFAEGTVGPMAAIGCDLTIRPTSQSAPASGGSFVVEIATDQGCDWAAASDDWITVTRGSGSGPGSVAYAVQPNATSSVRQGRVRVGDRAVSVTQSAASAPDPPQSSPPPPPPAPDPDSCDIDVSPTTVTMGDGPGTSEIVLTTGPRCEWEAATGAEWIRIEPTSGNGSARLRLVAVANPSAMPRATSVRIGSATVGVTQSGQTVPSCESLRLDPGTQASGVEGGSFSVAVVAPASCTWTVVSESWISVSPSGGSGSAALNYSVAPQNGPSRTGAIRIGGQTLTVNQAGCSIALSPESRTVEAGGGSFTVDVRTTGTACGWTASSTESWIVIGSGSGRGNGQVNVAVAVNPAGARTGQIRIGDRTIDVRQSGIQGACPSSVEPGSASFSASGTSDASFTVKAEAECKWSATSDRDWIVMTSGSGAGTGVGKYGVRENTGASERSGQIRIGEWTIAIRQAAAARPCPLGVDPPLASFTASGTSDASFTVKAEADCRWSATSDRDWIVMTSGSGAGTGVGKYSVRENTGASERSSQIRIGEWTIAVRQAPAPSRCPMAVDPPSATFTASGTSDASFTVKAAADCQWSATSAGDWIVITSGSGAGTGVGKYSVRENTGASERSGQIRIGEWTIAIRQAPAPSRCPLAVDPSSAAFTSSGSDASFTVKAEANCKWSATSDRDWIVMTSGSGAGTGVGKYSVRENSGASERSGQIRIGERTIAIRQAPAPASSPCPLAVDPPSASFTASGNDANFTVKAAADCRWSASANRDWIVIAAGAGLGNGRGGYLVRPNETASDRSGMIQIGGLTISITQAGRK